MVLADGFAREKEGMDSWATACLWFYPALAFLFLIWPSLLVLRKVYSFDLPLS
jgi:hypothetical protein